MKRLTSLLLVTLSLMLFLSNPVCVNASTIDTDPRIQALIAGCETVNTKNGPVFILGRGNNDDEAAKQAYDKTITCFPYADEAGVGITRTNGEVLATASPAYLQKVAANNDWYAAWTSANLPLIVPAGAKYTDIPVYCSRWVAAVMSYDREYKIAVDSGNIPQQQLHDYNSPRFGLEHCIGTCVTYAMMAKKLINFTPYNEMGLVDYSCPNPQFLRAYLFMSDTHAWNAVIIDGKLHYYDPTAYDTHPQPERWLDFPESELVGTRTPKLLF